MADAKATHDPRWVTIRRCFAKYDLRFSYSGSFPALITVKKVGTVAYGHLIGYTSAGPISSSLHKGNPNSVPNAVDFDACLLSSYG